MQFSSVSCDISALATTTLKTPRILFLQQRRRSFSFNLAYGTPGLQVVPHTACISCNHRVESANSDKFLRTGASLNSAPNVSRADNCGIAFIESAPPSSRRQFRLFDEASILIRFIHLITFSWSRSSVASAAEREGGRAMKEICGTFQIQTSTFPDAEKRVRGKAVEAASGSERDRGK